MAKYRSNPEAVKLAEEEQKKTEQEAIAIAEAAQEARRRGEGRTGRTRNRKPRISRKRPPRSRRSAEAAKADTAKRMKAATDAATPRDIVDIVVSEPIRILVTPRIRNESARPATSRIRRSTVAAILGAAWWCLVSPVATGAEIDFYRDVYPILKSNCIGCHNKTTTKAALNMETPEAMRKGGDSGAGVIPGNGAESLIFQAAAHTGDVEMPPKENKLGAMDLTPARARVAQGMDRPGGQGLGRSRRGKWPGRPCRRASSRSTAWR